MYTFFYLSFAVLHTTPSRSSIEGERVARLLLPEPTEMTKAVDVLVGILIIYRSKPISMNFHQRRQNYFQPFSNSTRHATCALLRLSISRVVVCRCACSTGSLLRDHAPVFHFLVFHLTMGRVAGVWKIFVVTSFPLSRLLCCCLCIYRFSFYFARFFCEDNQTFGIAFLLLFFNSVFDAGMAEWRQIIPMNLLSINSSIMLTLLSPKISSQPLKFFTFSLLCFYTIIEE